MTAKERFLQSSGTKPYRDTPRFLTTATGGIRFSKMIGMMIAVRMATVPNQLNRTRRPTIQRYRQRNHGCISPITLPLPVDRLTTNIATTMMIGNDSAGALRVNLSSDHRTTICVEIQGIVANSTVPASADVYLMTTSQYESYEWSYDRMHSQDFDNWFNRESLSEDEFVTDVSPEWAAFDVTG